MNESREYEKFCKSVNGEFFLLLKKDSMFYFEIVKPNICTILVKRNNGFLDDRCFDKVRFSSNDEQQVK